MNLAVYIKGDSLPLGILEQIKQFQTEDISEYFSDPYTFDIGIITDEENKVLGVGIIRVVDELKMSLNNELSNIEKAIALKALLNEAIARRHCGEILVMITQGGEHYVNLLQRHFDFQEIKGIPMKWEI